MIGAPTNNLREVEKELGELAQADGGTDLAATFEAVDRVLEVSSIPQKEVVFLTDLQAASWRRRPRRPMLLTGRSPGSRPGGHGRC